MKKYKLKDAYNRYFVKGKGFSGTAASATVVDCSEASCLAKLGFDFDKVEVVQKSYAVNYIRKENLDYRNQVRPDTRNPSRRRFASFKEAVQHGSRFQERRKNAGDRDGTAGHVGFYVTETSDPVNAEINWDTELTNAI